MRIHPIVVWILTIGVLATSLACSLLPVPQQAAPTTDPLQQTVNVRLTQRFLPTLTATQTDTPAPTRTITPTPSPAPPTATPLQPGGISGSLSYPAEFIPPLRIVAFRVGIDAYRSIDIPQNTPTYQIDGLEPGQYMVVAYLLDPGINGPTYGGGYSQAVLCGLTTRCSDHSLIMVDVLPGEMTSDIDPADWYAPIGAFPKNPSLP